MPTRTEQVARRPVTTGEAITRNELVVFLEIMNEVLWLPRFAIYQDRTPEDYGSVWRERSNSKNGGNHDERDRIIADQVYLEDRGFVLIDPTALDAAIEAVKTCTSTSFLDALATAIGLNPDEVEFVRILNNEVGKNDLKFSNNPNVKIIADNSDIGARLGQPYTNEFPMIVYRRKQQPQL